MLGGRVRRLENLNAQNELKKIHFLYLYPPISGPYDCLKHGLESLEFRTSEIENMKTKNTPQNFGVLGF